MALAGYVSEVKAVSFFRDGKTLAAGRKGRTVKLWDTVTGQETALIRGHGSEVSAVAWSPEGKYLVAGSLDGTVKIWDVNRREMILPAARYVLASEPGRDSFNDNLLPVARKARHTSRRAPRVRHASHSQRRRRPVAR
ncbi:MAG: WD40 repeat domain-containing protein [Blastocatellia bacterium]